MEKEGNGEVIEGGGGERRERADVTGIRNVSDAWRNQMHLNRINIVARLMILSKKLHFTM